MPNQTNQRSCGSCTLCCTLMAVTELKKPGHQDCRYQCAQGCRKYDERPESCRTFQCLWLEEGEHLATTKPPFRKRLLWESDRPDKIGFLLHGTEPNIELSTPALVARGNFESPAAKSTLQRMAKRLLIVLAYEDGKRKLMGPELAVREVQKQGVRLEERGAP